MSVVKQIYDCTKSLYDTVQNGCQKTDRDSYITNIRQYLNQRDKLIKKMPPDYTRDEQAMGEDIVRMNKTINEELQVLFNEIGHDRQQFKRKKSTNLHYVNPYRHINIDGMYYDKRK